MLTKIFKTSIFIFFYFVIFSNPSVLAQSAKYFGEKKIIPKIPLKNERIKVLIVSDAKNEIDDVWAIALAILYPERFDIQGFVGSNFEHKKIGEGHSSIAMSVNEINTVLDKAGIKGKYPVYAGSDPMQYEFSPSGSAGVDFIIEKAMKSTPEDPLWIIGLGAPTDLASAYLKEPAIQDRVVMFWHARTENTWPHRAINYNIQGDMHASRMMFHAPFPLVLFDTGTNLNAGNLEESEKNVRPYGELGQYLYDYRLQKDAWKGNKKGYFDLGDIAVLIDPEIGKWEEINCPTVSKYMDYNFDRTNGKILRCTYVDRDKVYQLLYNKLKEKYGINPN